MTIVYRGTASRAEHLRVLRTSVTQGRKAKEPPLRPALLDLPAPMSITLRGGEVISLKHSTSERAWWRFVWRRKQERVRICVRCASGKLWVTQAGDPADYILEAGTTFETVGAG